MNLITDTLQGLVRRKLWPVALLLVGALVAVPLMLAKNPEAPVVAANVTHGAKDEAMPATFVSADDAASEDTTERRRTLGQLKDPFEPKALPKVKKSKKAKAAAAATPTATPADSSASPGGGGATAPTSPAPTATPSPTVTVPAYSVKVRFGTTDSEELKTSTIERLSVLPDETDPVMVYRGVEDGGKIAIFELTGDIVAQGDGTCLPTPEDCQYLKLHAGETEFLTVSDTGEATDAQYQLDLVKIYKKETKEKVTDPQAATTAESLTKAASSSLKGKGFALRHRNRYVFDATTGTLHKAAKGVKTPSASL
ncbi:hypothetical protein OM076_39690 [Solirubrobacter ginsenosidimutans]|uniref:Uncharacterized protein n=1 Tax=Solirubrobacter ginsenosidimutans TaxID=490573 RepID=A0A9X3S484_9ACTN|nr:hypothetical protein [Solirubrobacter ginsenosidimutans]MDA0166455.1 hypothetical protein [Solirubrobacter ginsenosidimutans]